MGRLARANTFIAGKRNCLSSRRRAAVTTEALWVAIARAHFGASLKIWRQELAALRKQGLRPKLKAPRAHGDPASWLLPPRRLDGVSDAVEGVSKKL